MQKVSKSCSVGKMKKYTYQSYIVKWGVIPIEIRFCNDWLVSVHLPYIVTHIELRSNHPLPMTPTGYVSRFINRDEIPDPIEFVKEWFEQETKGTLHESVMITYEPKKKKEKVSGR